MVERCFSSSPGCRYTESVSKRDFDGGTAGASERRQGEHRREARERGVRNRRKRTGGALRPLTSIAVALVAALVFAASASAAARIYVPNYGSSPSSVSGYERAADGSLSVLAGSPFAMVPGPPYAVSGTSALAFAPQGSRAISSYLFEGGVAALGLDANGSVSPLGEPIVTASALGLAVSPDGRFAYVSTREFGGTPAEGIHAYSIGADGSLGEIAGSPFGGANEIWDLAMTPDGAYLFALRRDGTEIRRFSIAADGSLGELGPATATPGGATQALVSPDGRFLFVAFSGVESGVVSYAIGGDGSLTQDGEPALIGGVGLKYFDVAPSGRHIYLPDSDAETIVTVGVAADGRLSVIGSLAVEHVDAVGASPDGRFLYYARVGGGGGELGVAKIADNGLPAAPVPVAPWESGEPERIVFQPSETPVASFDSKVGVAGQGTSFDASASQRAARYDWDFGDGTVLSDGGPAPEHVYPEPGAYGVRLTVSDAQGCSTAALYTGQSTRCPGGEEASTVRQIEIRPQAPRLRALRVRPRRFAVPGGRPKARRGRSARVSGTSSRRARRAPRGAAFRYWLSRPATLRLVVQRRKFGRRVGGKCKRRTHANRKRRRCLLGYRKRGSPLYRHGKAGANRSRFSGWVPFRSEFTGRLVRRIKLSPGVYRLRAIAIDSEGATSKRRTTWFRVARR